MPDVELPSVVEEGPTDVRLNDVASGRFVFTGVFLHLRQYLRERTERNAIPSVGVLGRLHYPNFLFLPFIFLNESLKLWVVHIPNAVGFGHVLKGIGIQI